MVLSRLHGPGYGHRRAVMETRLAFYLNCFHIAYEITSELKMLLNDVCCGAGRNYECYLRTCEVGKGSVVRVFLGVKYNCLFVYQIIT